MQDILRQSNADLLREIERLREILQRVGESVPAELDIYYDWVLTTCDRYRQQVMQNLQDLDLGQEDTFSDIFSATQAVTQNFHLFNRRLVSPILRVQPSDRLSLKLLRWVHTVHRETRNIPAGLSDGEFGIWPAPPLPTIYSMPSSAQHGMLYLPLFFHEFGHLLYACHEPEMGELVREVQETIGELLEPSAQRDDLHAQVEAETRKVIVETWYEWTQEFFCDAVGLAVGGPAFVHAFSIYLRMRGRGEYHVPSEQLAHREHPVSWLRIRLLCDRARRMGYGDDAEALEGTWGTIAEAMGITEDYYGFYDPEFLPVIQGAIDDMLTEASPREFTQQEASGSETEPSSVSPVHLLNQAWRRFWEDPENYRALEESTIEGFLASEIELPKGHPL